MSLGFLDQQDRQLIQDLINKSRNSRQNPTLRDRYIENDHQAPDVYIGVAPTGGIAAAVDQLGTGSSLLAINSAYCKMYQVTQSTTSQFRITSMAFTVQVYNLAETAIKQGAIFLAIKSKQGYWFAAQILGSNPETAAVTITSSSPTLSRYPAVRRIQTGLPDEWPTAEVVWVYNMHPSGTLAAGMHLIARYNTDQFLGADQLAVRECCTIEPCECDIPALMCLTFGEEAGCLAGTVVIVRNGVSDSFEACGGRHRFTLTCSGTTWGGLFTTSAAYRVITIGCCPGDEISTQMTAQFSNPTGDCAGCFSLDPFEMNYIGGAETGGCGGTDPEAAWSAQVASSCDTLNPLGLLNLMCSPGGSCSWGVGVACSTNGATLLTESCNPFSRSYRLTIAPLAGLNSCCGDYPASGTIDVTFTGGSVADAGASPPCSMSVSTVNVTCGPPFSATLNGLMTGADCPNEGMFWTATLAEVSTAGDCGVSGGGSSCVAVGCEPGFVPPTLTLTFAFTG